MSSPVKSFGGHVPGSATRRPAKLRIANPDSSDEESSRASQTARREELFQRARLSQDNPTSHEGSGSATSSGPWSAHPGPSRLALDDIATPAGPERSQSSPTLPGARALPSPVSGPAEANGSSSRQPGYFAPQRSHSVLTNAGSTAATTPMATPSLPAVPVQASAPPVPPRPPPPPPPPSLTGRDLDAWKSIVQTQTYTSPTSLFPGGGSPPLRPLPRPAVAAQPVPISAAQSNASSSPSTASLPPISPGSPLSISLGFTSGPVQPAIELATQPRGKTPPPKSASWRNAPRPPSPLRTTAPATPLGHASSPLGLPPPGQTARSVEHPPIGRMTLLATTDGHKFASADVSGSTCSAMIREKIFTALEIPDDEQPAFLLRRHAMGGGASQMESALEGDSLYSYCAEPGEPIKGVLAVMSFEQSHPSMPIMPPPLTSGPSSSTSKSGRSDDYSNNSGRYPRPPTSQSETASSISELNALDETDDGRRKHARSGGAAYPTSSSETSVSAADMDHPSGGSSGGGVTSSLRRKPHQRRSSHLLSGPRRTTSPSSGSSRRREHDGSPASSVTSPTSPPIPLNSPEALGVDENLFGRHGSVTPTRPPLAEPSNQSESQRLAPPPLPYRRPPSMSPEEIQQMGSSASIDEQERILRSIQEARERDRRAVEEMIERERAEEMAREWERRDREEEAARRRRQIQEDEETAMEEQRKEQELYKARLEQQLEQQLERERSQRSFAQQQAPAVPVNEFGDWGFGAGRPSQGTANRSVPAGAAARANSLSGYQDPYRSAQTIGHRALDPSSLDHSGVATMFPSSRFAAQSALASQLLSQRPQLPTGPPSRTRGSDFDSHPGGGNLPRGGPSYPQSAYVQGPHPSMFPSAASAQDSSNRRAQQNSVTPQPQRLPPDGWPGSVGASQATHAHNLQQMRSNPNFRGGMPLPGQTRPRPSNQLQQQARASSGSGRAQDGPYLSGTLAIGGRRVASPPGNLSPPVQQGSFVHSQAYPSGPQSSNGYSQNASPNRSPLPLGPNSPRSPVLVEQRVPSPRPSTMFDAGQSGSSSALPRRPSSHHDPPSSAIELNASQGQVGVARGDHGRFATEGASSAMPTVDLTPPPPYMPSPEIRPSSPISVPSLSRPASPDAVARESAYGGLFDYMVSDIVDPVGSVSPNSTATGESTEIGYRLAGRASSASGQALPDDGDDDDDDSDDDTGTNALFLPPRPAVKSAPASAHPARSDDGEGDSTFTSQMRQLVLDNGGGDTFRSDESTLGPSGRPSNRSLPPINTSGTASAPASAISTTPQDVAENPLPPISASPERDTPSSGGAVGDEQLSTASHLRRKKTVFEKNEDKQWAFRPPAEQVVRELSKFFPEINLEAEFIEADNSPAGEGSGAASTASAAAAIAAAENATRETKLRNRKSIRRVAEERQRGDLPPVSTLLSTTQLQPPVDIKVVRRRSTRMWGGKVEEVKPGALKGQLGTLTPDASEAAPTFKWVKGDLIGKGAYGRVYLGLNATTGEMLAVKQVEVPSTMSDRVDDRQSQVIAALRSEIQLLKDLDHPNVVQYLGFEESPDFISIFLEYVPGGSLGSVFRKYGKLEEAEVRWFTRQILDGLAYLHGRGILHRDLKGDNILVDPNNHGVVKITDFGVSKQTLEEATQMGGTLMTGSLYWMAPEVVTNAGQGYNSKIDLWSLGCVVLEMLSGARPWQGLEMMPIILKLGHGERPPMPADLILSPEAADFVYDKSFAVNPAERFSATEALSHPFVRLDPDWDWARDSALARKVSSTRSKGGSGRGRRNRD